MHSTFFKTLKGTFIFGFFLTVYGQQSVSHPLSSYGIGDYQLSDHGIYSAMGNVQVPFIDSSHLNFLNPASYSALSKGNTLFSLGVNQRTSFLSQGNERMVRSTGNLNHLVLGFKLKQRMGMALGITPYAAKGYSLSEKIFTGVDSLLNSYEGSGYINRVFLGYSYAPIQTKNTLLSLGANGGYLFGGLRDQRSSQLIQGTTASGGLYQEDLQISAINAEFGLAFSQKIGSRYELKLGGTYAPNMKLAGDLQSVFYSASNLNLPSSYDTLNSQQFSGHVVQGQRIAVGLMQQLYLRERSRKNKTKHPQLNVMMQYSQQTQNDYLFTGSNYDSLGSFASNTSLYQIGIEFRPERFLYENLATLGFFDKFSYRIGGFYGQLPYFDATGSAFKAQALTFGLGIPILAQQSLSSINFSCIVGQRGTFKTGALQETFISVQLGAVLAPAGFERWFRKRKMD
jgi:hypothetical protein